VVQSLAIAGTDNTPEVDFDFAASELWLRGESYPENASAFFCPVIDALEAYLAEARERTITLNIGLIYFNSSSTKAIFHILDLLLAASEHGRNEIVVNWYHDPEDDNMREFGEEFAEEFPSLTFRVRSLEEEAYG
jgi:hypothetical protein